ncbi:hypothetical protein [Spirillospora sp. CA-294931]|uniref:hypothetical protein n=1 Tax=Spirillospora sp. CA-294931 TaxID=3240042 RepID=UPI003D947F58
MIPIYTTDHIPIAGSNPVVQAFPVWADDHDIGKALDKLAYAARQRGAHAVIGLRSSYNSDYHQHILIGTAVILAT